MTDFDVLVFIRDVMLANKHTDAEFVWNIFKMAERNGDAKELMHRWATALNNTKEQMLIESVMQDLLKVYNAR